MQDFMAQRGVLDKRQPEYGLAQQGEGGHGKTGGQPVFHHGKTTIRIRAYELFVALQKTPGLLAVFGGLVPVFREKI